MTKCSVQAASTHQFSLIKGPTTMRRNELETLAEDISHHMPPWTKWAANPGVSRGTASLRCKLERQSVCDAESWRWSHADEEELKDGELKEEMRVRLFLGAARVQFWKSKGKVFGLMVDTRWSNYNTNKEHEWNARRNW